jgi:autophagy-related protein 5
VEFFLPHVPALSKVPLWLEYDGVPISWNLPVGVLYDYLHLPVLDRTVAGFNAWSLRLRFVGDKDLSKYPWEQVVPFQYKLPNSQIDYVRSLEEIIINQLKQSTFILNGNSKPIMNLNEADSNELVGAIRLHNSPSLKAINGKIMRQITSFQKLPVKVYIPGSSHIIQSPVLLMSHHNNHDNHDNQDMPITLKSFLLAQFPDLFTEKDSVATVYIQGIDVSVLFDSSVELREIWDLFKMCDNFLHMVLIVKNE